MKPKTTTKRRIDVRIQWAVDMFSHGQNFQPDSTLTTHTSVELPWLAQSAANENNMDTLVKSHGFYSPEFEAFVWFSTLNRTFLGVGQGEGS